MEAAETKTIIKASDLRMGNWLNVIKRVPIKVTADHIKSISDGDQDYSPIELSPEILEKCRFRKWPRGNTFDIEFSNGNQFQIDLNDSEVFLGGSDSCTGGMGFTTYVKYLHQLQNLYFALTGEELPINL